METQTTEQDVKDAELEAYYHEALHYMEYIGTPIAGIPVKVLNLAIPLSLAVFHRMGKTPRTAAIMACALFLQAKKDAADLKAGRKTMEQLVGEFRSQAIERDVLNANDFPSNMVMN